MGACLSKKKGSAFNAVSTAPVSQLKNSGNGVTVTLSKPTNPELNLNKTTQEKPQPENTVAAQGQRQVKKEIFIIKHRNSHDESREKSPKMQPCNAQQNKSPHSDDGLPSNIASSAPNIGGVVVGVRTSSCTKEEVDAILIQCGRLSRSSSGRAASSSAGGGRKYSGSKRSFDFDHCDNDANFSADDDKRRANDVSATDTSDLCEDYDGISGEKRRHRHQHQHRECHRQSPRPSPSRRRTPSRERDQQNQRSSSRERRVSRSPGRRSSETHSSANGANAANSGNNCNNNAGSRPGKMVSVPATVSSMVTDKSNNCGGESGINRITVKRNVGECGMVGSRGSASPRSQSPARVNCNAANANVVYENQQQQQQQPSLSRNNSARKAEHSPYRRNPLSEIDPNALAYPQSNTNNGSSKVQNRPKKEVEAEPNQKSYALEKGASVNCNTKEQIEEEIRVIASMNDNHNAAVKTMVSSGVDNLKPQNLARSRSSRRSRDLDLNPEYESLLNNPTPQSYTSLLLEDIQNFHQKNNQQPSISLPACLSKAYSILEAVADLNSTTSANFSTPPNYRNEHNNSSSFGANNHHYGKNKVTENNTKDPFVESEVHVFDNLMEPSLHKYVTLKRGGSLCGVVDKNNMEDQESSGSNSFFTQQHHFGISSNTWEANSADSTDSWTSRLMEGSDAVAEARKALSCKKRECDDHQNNSGIGRGRLNGSSSSSSNNKCTSINIGL